MFSKNKTEKQVFEQGKELIRSFYPAENGKIILRAHDDAELFDRSLESGETPRFKRELFDTLDGVLLEMKGGKALPVSIEAPDGSGYNEDDFKNIVDQNLRLHLLDLIYEFKASRRKSLWLLGLGCALLLLSYFAGRVSDVTLIFDVINILGSLLIWTAGEGYFIDQAENRALRRRYAHLIEQINN